MKLKFKRLTGTAKIPCYAHEGDSGMDVCADAAKTIPPGGFALFPTGIAAEIPHGYELQVRPRSGLQCKHGVIGAWGTVDECYKGNIGVALYNFSQDPFRVEVGDRIAQLVLAPVVRAEIEETDDVGTSERGEQGFGSTGVRG